jgi:hypothetical protein
MKMFRLIIYSCLFSLFLCGHAYAASLSGCSGIETEGKKIILDRVEFESDDGKTLNLAEKYSCEFQMALLSRLRNLFPDSQTRPKAVLCKNRNPEIDGSDFMADLVRSLNNRGVLLELWGKIKAETQNGSQTLGGDIFIMIIPVRSELGSTSPLAFHQLSFPHSNRGALDKASKEMLFGPEFDVYTGIALGIKALKNNSYDEANRYFAHARICWEEAMKNKSLAFSATDQDRILGYIKELEQRTKTEAAADPDYHGDLAAVSALQKERGQ